MLYNRWFISIIGLALLSSLVVIGVAMRGAAAASPLAQNVTPTTTTTSTETVTPTTTITTTETATSTPIITSTETVTPTETSVPTTTSTPTATPGPIITGNFWSYAAKFVCGEQPAGSTALGEPTVRPGSYATEINIHNPNYFGPSTIYKKALLLVDRGEPIGREPKIAEPRAFGPPLQLPNDGATMDDCTSIWELANPGISPPTPMPLMVGYVVILSPFNLDVVSVMTATPAAGAGQAPGGIALETVDVIGKHVTIPASALPGGVLPPAEEFSNQQQP
jgi:hypothetical protein